MSISIDQEKHHMYYIHRDGQAELIAKSLIVLSRVRTASHTSESDYLITIKETRAHGYTHEFDVLYSSFNMNKDEARKQLNQNGFVFKPYYADALRDYITDSLMEFIEHDKLDYYHKSLGFTQMIDGTTQFLLGDGTYGNLQSTYIDGMTEFSRGSVDAYQDFLKREILPYKPTRFALALGLSSVLASDLQDRADINTIVMNLSGESSTGKTTVAQFIASLWGNPRISNRGIVRTFNSTHNSMIHSFTGINGVTIILDDATSHRERDFSSFLYIAAMGEDKLRMKSGSEYQESKGNWSGTIIVTSEDDLMESSAQTAGSIPRLMRLSGIEWTQDADHSKRIKRFIKDHFGFVGSDFVKLYAQIPKARVLEIYDQCEQMFEAGIVQRDQYTPRLISKYSIIATTATLIERTFEYEKFSSKEIIQALIDLENVQSKARSLEEQAYEIVKEYVVKNQYSLPKKVMLQGNHSEIVETRISRDFDGYIKYVSEDRLEVTILSKVVRRMLEREGITQWSTVLKRWRSNPNIKKYGEDSHVSEKDNQLQVKAITFYFNRSEHSLIQWDYQKPPTFDTSQTPRSQVSYDDSKVIDAIFEEPDEDQPVQ